MLEKKSEEGLAEERTGACGERACSGKGLMGGEKGNGNEG